MTRLQNHHNKVSVSVKCSDITLTAACRVGERRVKTITVTEQRPWKRPLTEPATTSERFPDKPVKLRQKRTKIQVSGLKPKN